MGLSLAFGLSSFMFTPWEYWQGSWSAPWPSSTSPSATSCPSPSRRASNVPNSFLTFQAPHTLSAQPQWRSAGIWTLGIIKLMLARSWTQQWRMEIFTSMPALRVVQIHLLWSVQGQTFPDNIKKLITHNLIISTPALTRTSHKAFSLWWQRSATRRRLGRELSSTVEYIDINLSWGLEAARSHLPCTTQ